MCCLLRRACVVTNSRTSSKLEPGRDLCSLQGVNARVHTRSDLSNSGFYAYIACVHIGRQVSQLSLSSRGSPATGSARQQLLHADRPADR